MAFASKKPVLDPLKIANLMGAAADKKANSEKEDLDGLHPKKEKKKPAPGSKKPFPSKE